MLSFSADDAEDFQKELEDAVLDALDEEVKDRYGVEGVVAPLQNTDGI